MMDEIQAFIRINLHQKITAKSLSVKAGMSITGFRDAFRQHSGYNVFAYVKKERMQLAARLLIENYLPLKQVAAQCGYQHTSHFSRAVKRFLGFPPAQIRQQAVMQKN
jgi:AraC-like DNA-binding protein